MQALVGFGEAAYERRADVEPFVQRLRAMVGERTQLTAAVLPPGGG